VHSTKLPEQRNFCKGRGAAMLLFVWRPLRDTVTFCVFENNSGTDDIRL